MRFIRTMNLYVLLLIPCFLCQKLTKVAQLERKLLSGYNSRARPVKNDETVTKVSVFLNIAHIERIDEREQTMLVHGHLWASWFDEYMKWRPEEYNGTSRIQLAAWKLWQPAFALYNSAKGNAWHLYMNGLPATIYSTGKVWASGTYSFYVTCLFDFSNWPFDQQQCPIVIADWVYDLSRVNLSDPDGFNEYTKPTIRLSYDPVSRKDKRHIGGWEIKQTWKKHCYWGPNGCKEQTPEGKPEWYWSLLEFGLVLKRHVPYYGATIIIPTAVTIIITLSSFWVTTFNVTISMLIFNIILQGIYGWEIIEKMPPGSGSVPKIIHFYTLNLFLCCSVFVYTIVTKYLEDNLPLNYKINIGSINISELPKILKIDKMFENEGISFDPQELLNSSQNGIEEVDQSATSQIGVSEQLKPLDDCSDEQDERNEERELVSIDMNEYRGENHGEQNLEKPDKLLKDQLHIIRRLLFIIYVVLYTSVLVAFYIF